MLTTTTGDLNWPLTPPAKPDSAASDEQWAQAQSAAVGWLWGVSGRRYGTRLVTLRPQTLWTVDRRHWGGISPYLAGAYRSLWAAPDDRFYVQQRTLQLPGPAQSVELVSMMDANGFETVLDAGSYRLDGDYLVRTDGQPWPDMQNLIANYGQPNTWQVIYTRGVPVPIGGQIAAALLAAEWLTLLLGKKDACKLPWNTVSASRGGVTVQLQASIAYRTSGINGVDRWVTNVNPEGLTRPPRIWSPDTARNGTPYAGSAAAAPPAGFTLGPGMLTLNGDGTATLTATPGLATLGGGLYSLTSVDLVANPDGTYTYTGTNGASSIGQLTSNGDGTYTLSGDPGLSAADGGLYNLTSTRLHANTDGTYTYTQGAAV